MGEAGEGESFVDCQHLGRKTSRNITLPLIPPIKGGRFTGVDVNSKGDKHGL